MATVECTGNETSLNECKFSGWGTSECDYGESAGIQCFDNENSTTGPGNLSIFIRKTCLCNIYPLKPHCYIEKLGYAGVYLFFLIFAPKHRLWVLVRTALARRF